MVAYLLSLLETINNKVYKMKTLQEAYIDNPVKYKQMATKGNKEGKILSVDENDELILVEQEIPKNSYKELREAEYPSVGDMIDAFCKAKKGDESELIILMEKRESIKEKYPKDE